MQETDFNNHHAQNSLKASDRHGQHEHEKHERKYHRRPMAGVPLHQQFETYKDRSSTKTNEKGHPTNLRLQNDAEELHEQVFALANRRARAKKGYLTIHDSAAWNETNEHWSPDHLSAKKPKPSREMRPMNQPASKLTTANSKKIHVEEPLSKRQPVSSAISPHVDEIDSSSAPEMMPAPRGMVPSSRPLLRKAGRQYQRLSDQHANDNVNDGDEFHDEYNAFTANRERLIDSKTKRMAIDGKESTCCDLECRTNSWDEEIAYWNQQIHFAEEEKLRYFQSFSSHHEPQSRHVGMNPAYSSQSPFVGMMQLSEPAADLVLDAAFDETESNTRTTDNKRDRALAESFLVDARLGEDGAYHCRDKKDRGLRRQFCIGFTCIALTILVVGGIVLATIIYGQGRVPKATETSNLSTATEAPTSSVSNMIDGFLPETPDAELLLSLMDQTTSSHAVAIQPTASPTEKQTLSPTHTPFTASPTPRQISRPYPPEPTPWRTNQPITDNPTPYQTNAPTRIPTPRPTASSVATEHPTQASLFAANEDPTLLPTQKPWPTNGPITQRPAVNGERVKFENITIEMTAEASSTNMSDMRGIAAIATRIFPKITVNGKEFYAKSCYMVRACDPYLTIFINDSITFFDASNEWYTNGVSSPLYGNDGFHSGSMELRIDVEDGVEYVWNLAADEWFQSRRDYETPYNQNVNGNGNLIRWKFDVVPV